MKSKKINIEILLLVARKLLSAVQFPFHFTGGGSIPLSLKLYDSGQIPDKNPWLINSIRKHFMQKNDGEKPVAYMY